MRMIGDPGLIAMAQAGLDQSALVLKYQRILLDQLDELPLDGISDIRHIKLRLNDIYIERTLAQIDLFAAQQLAVEPNTTRATLVDLIRAPGARIVVVSDIGGGEKKVSTPVRAGLLGIGAGGVRPP